MRIARTTEYELAYYERQPHQAPERLRQLDRERDIERAVQTEAPVVTVIGIALGVTVPRAFFIVLLAAQAMLLLHALQGWYPLLPLLRRIRFRTPHEIERERASNYALSQPPVPTPGA